MAQESQQVSQASSFSFKKTLERHFFIETSKDSILHLILWGDPQPVFQFLLRNVKMQETEKDYFSILNLAEHWADHHRPLHTFHDAGGLYRAGRCYIGQLRTIHLNL